MATSTTSTANIPGFNKMLAHKRKEKDVLKLLMSDFKVTQNKENPYDIVIEFHGPKGSLYEGGKWNVSVMLPDAYPYKSPSIGFNNKIYHPNVDETSGSVCLDVINQTWSPIFDLVNIFDTFLPQLLLYPNPSDPLNPEAAAMMLKFPSKYEDKVKEHVKKHACACVSPAQEDKKSKDEDQELPQTQESYSDVGESDAAESDVGVDLSEVSELSDTSDIDLNE